MDAEEIQKVILNLVLNAVEASESGGWVRVEIGAESMAYVRVIDNGCGISKEFLQKRFFMPFSTTKQKGLGIGLYHCRQIVEARPITAG